MKIKILEFPRSKKNPEHIELEINKILSQYSLFYAHQMENPSNSKVIITLMLKNYETKSKTIRQVKAFRKTKLKDMEAAINQFMSEKSIKAKFFSQSFSSNTVTALVFHDVSRSTVEDIPPGTEGNDTPPEGTDTTTENS